MRVFPDFLRFFRFGQTILAKQGRAGLVEPGYRHGGEIVVPELVAAEPIYDFRFQIFDCRIRSGVRGAGRMSASRAEVRGERLEVGRSTGGPPALQLGLQTWTRNSSSARLSAPGGSRSPIQTPSSSTSRTTWHAQGGLCSANPASERADGKT